MQTPQSDNTFPNRKINGTFQRVIIHPDPILAAERLSVSVVMRFFSKVDKTDTCWNWTGTHDRDGGVIGRGGQGSGNINVRCLSWLIYYGTLPVGKNRLGEDVSLRIQYSCGNALCVRPEHLCLRSGALMPPLDLERAQRLLDIPENTLDYADQDPTLPPGFSRTFKKRFWAKVQKTDSCWLWTGALNSDGYGAIGKGRDCPGNVVKAHTASWIIHKGQVPIGFVLRHKCPGGPNPRCVNPDHLCLGSKYDNANDAAVLLRAAGKAHWNAKLLTIEKVTEIRRLAAAGGITNVELGQRFGVNPHYISKIIHGHAWNRPGCLAEKILPGLTGQDLDYYI